MRHSGASPSNSARRAAGSGLRREPGHHRPSVERLVLDRPTHRRPRRTGGKGRPAAAVARSSSLTLPGTGRARGVASRRSSAGSRPRMFATARRSSLLSWVGTPASSPSKARRRARYRRARARGDGPPRPRIVSTGAFAARPPRRGHRTRRTARRRTALPIRWPSSARIRASSGALSPCAAMQIHFLGGATTVTGSQFLLETSRARVLVDCGMFQGSPNESIRNRVPFAYDPTTSMRSC